MTRFEPQLNILPPTQQQLWPAMKPITEFGFVLYGGTALALRLGHRQSVDFDFFSDLPLDKVGLVRRAPFLAIAQTIQDEPQTWTVLAPSMGSTVKLSFFGSLNLPRVGDPQLTTDGVCEVASALDIFGTKMKVLLQRVESKDYRDIYALLKSGESVERGLAAAEAIYGAQFQPSEALKALTYFEGGDLDVLTADEKSYLIESASSITRIPRIPIASRSLSSRAIR